MEKFKAYIDEVGQTKLANQLGVTRQAVFNWRHGLARPDWAITKEIHKVSGGQLELHDIRPDIFNPGDV